MTIYLSGVSHDILTESQHPDLGLLATPASSVYNKRHKYGTWAADNGLFAAEPGDDAGRAKLIADWEDWIFTIDPAGALFATLPDVVGDHATSWPASLPYVEIVRELGFPVGIVMQNGLERDPFGWRAMLAAADVLFIGGSPECLPCGYVKPATKAELKRQHCPNCSTGWDPRQYVRLTEWKLGAACAELVAEAKAAGKWVHMGRVNSWKRFAYAGSIGCDSADGTYVKFGPSVNAPKVLGWLDKQAAANEEAIAA